MLILIGMRSGWFGVMQHLRIIPTLTHALLDHLIGLGLILAPWIFEYHLARGSALHVSAAVGGLVVINSLVSDHEMGLGKWIGMKAHLWIDTALGLFLMISPWLFGFADRVFLPHLIAGLLIALIPLFSERKPFDDSIFTEVVIRRDGKAEIIRYATSANGGSSSNDRA